MHTLKIRPNLPRVEAFDEVSLNIPFVGSINDDNSVPCVIKVIASVGDYESLESTLL